MAAFLAACATGAPMGEEARPDAQVPPVDPSPDAPLLPDAARPVDARLPIDAAPPDAAPTATEVSALDPKGLVLTRGTQTTLKVTLDFPAPAEGSELQITVDNPALSAPAVLVVPAGAISAPLPITAVSAGLASIRASLGDTYKEATIRVVPKLVSLATESTELLVGSAVPYTVILEENAQVDVELRLTSDMPGMANVQKTATIPAGMDRVSFDVTGVELGARIEIQAAIGPAIVRAPARVLGLFLSEILYDIDGEDSTKEWVELYNATDVTLDVSNVMIAVATSGQYAPALTLAGTLAPKACVLVGGPTADSTNFMQQAGLTYFNAGDFSPDLGNAGTKSTDAGDGLSLWARDRSVIDNVIYGRSNAGKIQDEDGVAPDSADVGDAPPNQSIERQSPGLRGTWAIQPAPSPGRCALMSAM